MTKKLLIIDDSSTQLNILKAFFTSNGWEVYCVQSAKIGLEMIYDFAPDLIITDALMPHLGGFQLIKLIREDLTISKIPVIVYSILGQTNAKFYIKEEYSEYFLSKNNNHEELLKLARKVVEKFPIDNEYKEKIIEASLKRHKNNEETTEITETVEELAQELSEELSNINETDESKENEEIKEEKQPINFDKLRDTISNFNYSNSDNILFTQLYNLLNKEIGYDLGLFYVYCFDDEIKKIYFDIRKIILSPILINTFLNKYHTQNKISFKQYAPNMDTISNINDFVSKTEFNISYKDEILANIEFYSKEENKWSEDELNILKDILYGFFKKRNIQRHTQANKNEKFSSKYQNNTHFEDIKNTPNAFFAIVQIVNYADLINNLSNQELDILNSKISEKIIEYTDKNEQVYRNDEDEYDIVFFAKDNKHARYRLEYISKAIEEINQNENKIQVFIVGANCTIENNVNIIEAQKNARKTLEEANFLEKVVIYDERQ